MRLGRAWTPFAPPCWTSSASARPSSSPASPPSPPPVDALNQCNAVSEGIMTNELRNFLELNLPKVKEGKKAKYSLGVMVSWSPRLGLTSQRPRVSPARATSSSRSCSEECGCTSINSLTNSRNLT